MDTNTIMILVGIAAYFILPKLGSLGTLLGGILKPSLPANPNLIEQIVEAIAKMLADRFLPKVQQMIDERAPVSSETTQTKFELGPQGLSVESPQLSIKSVK